MGTKVKVRVPATSANVGSGFDSAGIALSLYNTITVEEIPDGLKIVNLNTAEYIPQGENNLIYRAAKVVFDKLCYEPTGLKIVQDSTIPMTRGLGSSSACILGGMLAANKIAGDKLTREEILNLAVEMEGHPDNVTPAMYGGFCVAVAENKKIVWQSIKPKKPPLFAAMVTDSFLSTRRSRTALPKNILHKDATYNVGRAGLLAMAFATGNYQNLKYAVCDKLHQPYRKSGIENMDLAFDVGYKNGAYAVWLSGSGTTIVAAYPRNDKTFCDRIGDSIPNRLCIPLTIDNVGAIVQVIDNQ